jgi:hypothetical protein
MALFNETSRKMFPIAAFFSRDKVALALTTLTTLTALTTLTTLCQ